MKIRTLLVDKNKLSKETKAQFFALKQRREEEFFPFLPPEIVLYKKIWNLPASKYEEKKIILALDENEMVVGYIETIWNTQFDNLHQARVELYNVNIDEDVEIIKILLKEQIKLLPSNITSVCIGCFEGTFNEKFLKKFGVEPNYEEIYRCCDLEQQNTNEVKQKAQELRKTAVEKGYEILFFKNMKFSSDFSLDEYIKVVESIWNDMPRDKLTDEDSTVNLERYFSIYNRLIQTGDDYFIFIAMHRATNKPIAYTMSSIHTNHYWVSWQDDTGVIHEHRGNGLGLSLKFQMLDYLLENTKAKYWITGTSSINEYMIRINDLLGYKKWKSEYIYEFKKEELEEKLNKLE